MRLSGDPDVGRDTATREGMSRGVAFSVGLHVALVALLIFGLPDLFASRPPQDEPMAVNLVTIARDTRATHPNPFVPRPKAKPRIPLADTPAPKPLPKPEPPLPTPPAPSMARTEPAPPHRAKLQKVLWHPPVPEKPKLAARPELIPVHVPHPPQKPHPPRPREVAKAAARSPHRQKTYNPAAFETLLKNLAPEHYLPSPDKTPQTRTIQAATASSQPKAPLGSALTASEIDLIRQQIERCWDIPEGVRQDKTLDVQVQVSVDPNGNVTKATIVDDSRMDSDPLFRAAADSARSALFNPQCRPLRLPPDKYAYWKEFIVDFSPRDLL